MPNPSSQFEDQAHELRQRIKNEETHDQMSGEEDGDLQSQPVTNFSKHKTDMDILNLPPRSVIHTDKKTGWKWKLQYPLIRLLMIVFILLIITLPLYHAWKSKNEQPEPTSNQQQDIGAGETVWVSNEADLEPDTSAGSVNENDQQENAQEDNANDSSVEVNSTVEASTGEDEKINDEQIKEQTEAVENVEPQQQTNTKETQVVTKYQVKKGDTLFSIAKNFYGGKYGLEIIRNENHLKNDEIYVGQWLRIPKTN